MTIHGVLKLVSTGIVVFFLHGCSSVEAHHDTLPKNDKTFSSMAKFQNVFEKIRKHYVEPVDDEKILEAAIRGMVSSLDSHSSYLTPKELTDMSERLDESYTGIGADITKDKETNFIRVIAPLHGSPAERAGLLTDDLIMSVNGTKLDDKSASEAAKLIRGPEGSAASLEIMRGNDKKTIVIVREKLKLQTVRSKTIDDIGYIKVRSFNSHVSDLIKDAITDIQKKKEITGLILDFRNNPGGLLEEAIKVTDLFVNSGVIVSTKGRDVVHHTTNRIALKEVAVPLTMPIVVLINKGSASASEIVAGSLQDLNRAMIIGVKSYGKGSVQTIMPLSGGGALRLTTAKYYTASNRVIHGVGISPDIIVEIPENYAPTSADDIDPQLRMAIDYLTIDKNDQ